MTSSSATPATNRYENYVEFLKSKAAEFRNREKVWYALSRYVHSAGGWAVSVPGDFTYMRIETPQLSEIPIRLAERGFKLNYAGSGATRVTGAGIIPVDVIEIRLGK
jgi:hypothetical protein